ncbi:hypothetical protein DFS33DRAFT_443144 [Desarmillaria ectypa]|nr:hypothetical protein DFS33DRAFT_443144 [Desarmillaria ectypa]
MVKPKFWAVRVGREGPKIYTSWEECEKNVSRYPSAKQKGFPTRVLAEEYIGMFRLCYYDQLGHIDFEQRLFSEHRHLSRVPKRGRPYLKSYTSTLTLILTLKSQRIRSHFRLQRNLHLNESGPMLSQVLTMIRISRFSS